MDLNSEREEFIPNEQLRNAFVKFKQYNTAKNIHFIPDIPEEKLDKAISVMKIPTEEKVLIIIDHAYIKIAITTERIYLTDNWLKVSGEPIGETTSMKFEEIKSFGIKPGFVSSKIWLKGREYKLEIEKEKIGPFTDFLTEFLGSDKLARNYNDIFKKLTKPKLPLVPKSIMDNLYKPSGKCPAPAIVLMLGIGLSAAAIIGLIAHYASLVLAFVVIGISGLLLFLAALTPGLRLLGLLVAFGIGLIYGIGYPIVVGAALGGIIGGLARWGKCRNPKIAGICGFLAGLAGYTTLSAITIKRYGMLRLSSEIVSIVLNLTNTPWGLYILVGIDALLFLGMVGWMVTRIYNTPFCEECNKWYSSKDGGFLLEIAEPLLLAIQTGSTAVLENLENLEVSSMEEIPYLSVELLQCSSCKTGDVKVVVTLFWKEVTINKKGKEEVSDEYEKWFETMLPNKLGVRLAKILFMEQGKSPLSGNA